MNTNDFVKGVDFTGYVQATAADLNQLVDQAQVGTDRGLLWITTDILDDSPQVPNPTGAIARGTRCIWIRKPYSANSTIKIPICYLWDDLGTSSGTYLKWIRLTAPLDNGTVGLDQINDTLAGLGLQLNVDEGLVVKLSTSTIATLRNIDATNLEAGTIIFVNCHTVADDGGDGFFELRKATVTDADDDNGSKICSSAFPTFYWSRIVSGEKRYPEWFGAKGDGVTNDRIPILACHDKYDRIDFKAKTYLTEGAAGIYGAIGVHTNSIITGEGMDKTIIKLKDNALGASGATASPTFFYVILNNSLNTADNVIIRDLTIDCNAAGQPNVPCTIGCIYVNGSNTLIENVHCMHYVMGGTATFAHECFAIACKLNLTATNLTGPVIRGCLFTDLGNNSTSTIPSYFPESNCIVIDCEQDANYTRYFDSPVIENCRALGLRQTTTQKSPIHVFSLAGTRNAQVRGNTISQVDGTGVFFQAFHCTNTLIEGNTFDRCWCGLHFQVGTNTSGYVDYDGWFKDTIFRNNFWSAPEDASYTPYVDAAGVIINLFGTFTACLHPNGTAYVPMDGVVIENNTFKGLKYTGSSGTIYPHGVMLIGYLDGFNNISVKNNIFELPDYDSVSAQSAPNLPYQNSVVYKGLAAYFVKTKFYVGDNRNYNGIRCLIKQCDTTPVYVGILATDWYNQSSSWFPTDYPPNLDCLHYDRITKNIWMPIALKTEVASGSLVPGRTYLVLGTGHVDYDDGVTVTSYYDNQAFTCVSGKLTYVDGGAKVYEHYMHCYKSLMTENSVPLTTPITVTAGVSSYRLPTGIQHLLMQGVCSINFDTTDDDKMVYMPDARLYAGCRFSIILTKGATTGSRYLYLVNFDYVDTAPPTIPKTGTSTSGNNQLVTNTLALAAPLKIIGPAGSTTAGYTMVEVTSDGTHWYIR